MQPGFRRKLLLLLVIVVPALAAALYLRWAFNPKYIVDRHPETPSTARERTPDHLRVLFLGNSLTFVNGGLPLAVQRLVDSARASDPALKPIIVERVTAPGASLEELWAGQIALKRIREGNWDFIVLQDYSQQPLLNPREMAEYINRFDGEAKKVGARTLLYMTWPLKNRPQDLAIIAAAYERAGHQTGAEVVPVGRVWQTVRNERPGVELYEPDEKHPSQAGSYLTSCLFFAALYGRSPMGLTDTIADRGVTFVGVSADEAAYLQGVAARAMGVAVPTTTPAIVESGRP